MIEKFNFKWDIEEIQNIIKTQNDSGNKGYVCAVNANSLILSYKFKKYREIIYSSIFNICDGINVKRINNITNKKKIEVLTGPDLFELFIKKSNISHYFLGGAEDVLLSLKSSIKRLNQNINEEMFYSPPFLKVHQFDYVDIAERINKFDPEIIWVGLGAPKQEEFMSKLSPYLNKGVQIGVGAAFNFYSGIEKIKRAPKFLRELRLEWLFRLFQDPFRIFPRQIRAACYLPLVLINELRRK